MTARLSGAARAQLRWIVDRYHVGLSDDAVRADIRGRVNRSPAGAWTPADAAAATAYAVRCHHANRALYVRVTGSPS